jgi:adenine-specific DNA-methyltransferase
VITSPPYNIGKAYERVAPIDLHLAFIDDVIGELARILVPSGSICWQVGNFVDGTAQAIVPLDIVTYPLFVSRGFKLHNRIVWTFGHGLHCSRRFSGRYETVMWLSRDVNFHFDLDAVRIPQLWPGKRHYKGPRRGELSGNPKGKNPGDVWEISNVKNNHPEKTDHPCQFPEELVQRLVLALTLPGATVLDPFAGSGTVGVVALRHGRNAILIEVDPGYAAIAQRRVKCDSPLFTHSLFSEVVE